MKNGRVAIWTQAHRLHHVSFPQPLPPFPTTKAPPRLGKMHDLNQMAPCTYASVDLASSLAWPSPSLLLSKSILQDLTQIPPPPSHSIPHRKSSLLNSCKMCHLFHSKVLGVFIIFFKNVYIIHSLIQRHIHTLSSLLKWLSTSRCQEAGRLFFFVSLKLSWYKI